MASDPPHLDADTSPAGRAFRTLFEFAPVPMGAYTLDGRIFALNRPGQALLGVSATDGLLVESVLVPELLVQWREDSNMLASGTRREITRELPLVRADGRRVEIRGTIMLVRAPVGEPPFGLAVMEPLDEQIEVKQNLQSARRYVHDVANLLTAIVGSAEALLDRLPPRDPAREEAMEVHEIARKAVALARASLGQATRMPGEAEAVDVNGIILGLREVSARLLGSGIEIVLIPDLRRPHAWTDPIGLERALVNIASNARDAMPGGGTFTIETELRGDSVLLKLTDTGVGMSPNVRDAIFEPGFTTKQSGHGVGLASVRDFVAKYGGTVIVESTPGKGSKFVLTLRAAAGP